jgi:ornithine carbamoyltransferase
VVSLRGRDFLDIADLDPAELGSVLALAHAIKAGRWTERPLAGKHVAMLFQKPSHRTRVSFEVGIARLGGTTTTLGEQDVQLGRRESVADAARVLDRYVDLIVARMRSHTDLVQLAGAAEKPVINALTDRSHPCQILADLMTIREAVGKLDPSLTVAFVGDGNNVVTSLVQAAALLGFGLTVVSPPQHLPARNGSSPGVRLTSDLAAVEGADVVYTDVWTSMGQEATHEARLAAFGAYQVNATLMAACRPDTLVLHCLPAKRGLEITDEVIDGPNSVVWTQAENRMHSYRSILVELTGED